MNNTGQDLQKRKEAAMPKGVGNLFSIFVDKAKNAELWDTQGKRYIDFGAGIAVVNTGNTNEEINAAVVAQIHKFTHTCFMINPYESGVSLAEKINALVPIKNAKTMFVTTGAEAVENAIKVARAYTKRSGVIAFNGSFHGRTSLCLGLTGKVEPYKVGFSPFPNQIYHIPFPIPYYGITQQDTFKALDNLFSSSISPDDVAAIIIEPVQGEGGFHTAPIEFLQKLRELCTQHGIVLICDEIQTGFARTGKVFVTEKYGIEPDLMTMAKGLGGGFPLAALSGKAEVMDASVSLGGTFGGSPAGCAAALAVIDIIKKNNLCEKALHIGEKTAAALNLLHQQLPDVVTHVRNNGAMIAFDIEKGGLPDKKRRGDIIQKSAENGLLILPCGIKGNSIRILTPLTIEDKVLDEGIEILKKTIIEICK